MAEHEAETPNAPYNVTWTTFINAIEKMELSTVPNRLDGSYLSSMAGGTRPYFLAAMRFFGLINDVKRAEPPLHELVANPEKRRERIGDLLNQHYPFEPLAVANATADELLEAIKARFGTEGETARKQMSFYLQGCRWAGLPLSPHWPIGKPGVGASGARRKNGATSSKSKKPTKPAETEPSAATAESRTVTLESGMTLNLTASQPLLSLPHGELAKVLDLIKTFDDLGGREAASQ